MRTTKKAKKNPEELEKLGFRNAYIGVYKIEHDGAYITIDINTREVDVFIGIPSDEKVDFLRRKQEELKRNGLVENS